MTTNYKAYLLIIPLMALPLLFSGCSRYMFAIEGDLYDPYYSNSDYYYDDGPDVIVRTEYHAAPTTTVIQQTVPAPQVVHKPSPSKPPIVQPHQPDRKPRFTTRNRPQDSPGRRPPQAQVAPEPEKDSDPKIWPSRSQPNQSPARPATGTWGGGPRIKTDSETRPRPAQANHLSPDNRPNQASQESPVIRPNQASQVSPDNRPNQASQVSPANRGNQAKESARSRPGPAQVTERADNQRRQPARPNSDNSVRPSQAPRANSAPKAPSRDSSSEETPILLPVSGQD